ncbi:MAG: hypothetical protein HY037_07235 [Nitrospirae bacterium]|nr:hypothetical protein [Candidatus Troglogloeales bacterium]
MKEIKRLIAMRYFCWWFAWGIFSAIMVFIVLKGGNMKFQHQLAIILWSGVVAGFTGLFCYLRKSRP